jgi:DHA1 family tetracycline resistance protein-like MFS transporter
VTSIAGIVSPVFFGAVYASSVGEGAWIPLEGAAFLVAAMVLGLAGWIGYLVARRESMATGVAESETV